MAEPSPPAPSTPVRAPETRYTPARLAELAASGQLQGFGGTPFPQQPEKLFQGGYKSQTWQPVSSINFIGMMKREGSDTAEPFMLVLVRGTTNATLLGTAGPLTRRPDTPAIYNALYQGGPNALSYAPSTDQQRTPITLDEKSVVGESLPNPQPLDGPSGLAAIAREALASRLGVSGAALTGATISGGPLTMGFVPVDKTSPTPDGFQYEPIGMQSGIVYLPDVPAFQAALLAARENSKTVRDNYSTIAWVPVADFVRQAKLEPDGPHLAALVPSVAPDITFGGLGLPATVAQLADPKFKAHLGPAFALAEQCQAATSGVVLPYCAANAADQKTPAVVPDVIVPTSTTPRQPSP